QALAAAVSGNDTELHFRLAKNGILGCDSKGAGHRELTTAAERKSIDGGDHGLAEIFYGIEDRLSCQRVLLPRDRSLGREFVDVGAGHEGFFTRSSKDNHADV